MAPKHNSSNAGSASKTTRSRDVLSISEKVKMLDMIEIGKKKKSPAEIARLYGKNEKHDFIAYAALSWKCMIFIVLVIP